VTFGLEWYAGAVVLALALLALLWWYDSPRRADKRALRAARKALAEEDERLQFPAGCGAAHFTMWENHTCICRYPYCDGHDHVCLCGAGWNTHPSYESETE
jgi:hypothetical protein